MDLDHPTPSIALGRLASAVIATAAIPAVGVLVMALYGANPFLTVDQILVYYLAPAFLLIALAACSRSTPATRLNVAVLIMALGVATVAAEIGLTFVLQRREAEAAARIGPSLGDIVRQARNSGVPMYPAVPGNVLVDRNVSLRVGGRDLHPITPAAGGALTALCEEQPGGITYESDRYGFNNTDGIWDRASLDVALVGDSFTQGVCVQRPDQLAMLLNAQGFSTINLGARGAGPLQSLAILREYAAERQPGAVVWTYYEGNDLFDLGKEVNRPWLTDYLDESHRQGLAAVAEGIGPAYAAWIDSLLIVGPDSIGAGPRTLPRVTLRLRDIAKMVSLRELSGFGSIFPTRVSSIGVVPEVLAQAHREVKAWNGRLYLVYLPAFERYRTLIGEGIEGRREILRAAESAGIPVIDLDMVFRETGDPRDLWAHPRGHLTEEGYRIMAGAIANRLRSDLAH